MTRALRAADYAYRQGIDLALHGDVPDSLYLRRNSSRPFAIGAAQNDRGLAAWDAYRQYIGERNLIAVDFAARAAWTDIENPTFVFDGWASWFRAHPTQWLMLALDLLPDTLNPATAQNWTDGANGVHDAHFNTFADNLIASGCKRLILRLHHEFNLAAIPGGSIANWVTYWKRVVNLLRAKFTTATGVIMKTCWNPTCNIGGLDLDAYWPGSTRLATVTGGIGGDAVGAVMAARSYPFKRRYACAEVDYIGIDIYDQNPGDSLYTVNVTPTDAQRHGAFANYMTGFTEFTGYEAAGQLIYMQRLAAETGTPLCIPEWGCWQVSASSPPAGGDNPIFISKMYDWFVRANVAFACYFDVQLPPFGALHQLWPGMDGRYLTVLPRASQMYRELF